MEVEMKIIVKGLLFLVVACCFTALPLDCLAQETSPETKESGRMQESFYLDELVVTATRTEKDVDDAPANVTVISSEELALKNIHNIEDALVHESGIFNGKLRGLPAAHHTLIMVNGMPMNTGWRGHVRWENIAIENVDQIDIIRGPASALYGGNAMGGVINILTDVPQKFEATARVGYGSDETIRHSLSLANRYKDKFSLRLGYEFEESDGYPDSLVTRSISSGTGEVTGGYETLDKNSKRKWVAGDKGDEYYERWNTNVDAVYDLTDTGSLTFNFQYGFREYGNGRPNTYLRDTDGNPVFSGKIDAGEDERASVSLSNYITAGPGEIVTPSYLLTYKETVGPVILVVKAGYHNEDRWYTTPKVNGDETYDTADGYLKEFDSDVWYGDIQTTFSIGEKHTLTAGVSSRSDKFDGGRYEVTNYHNENSKYGDRSDITQGEDRLYAVYLQDDWQVTDDLTIFLGGRFDSWETFDGLAVVDGESMHFSDRDDSAFNPKLSAVWKPFSDTIIKGSVGKAFRPPSLYELYRTYTRSNGGMIYGNPALEPETLENYEVGVSQYLYVSDTALKLSLTGFHTEISDLIYYYDIGDDRFKDNAGEARIDGFELEASIWPVKWLNVWGNYTYNDTEIKENVTDPEMEGKNITDMPESTVNLGVALNSEHVRASLMGRYLGRIYLNDDNSDIDDVYGANSQCWLWEAKITVSPVEHVSISLSVDNILDEDYFESSLGRERSYFIETTIDW